MQLSRLTLLLILFFSSISLSNLKCVLRELNVFRKKDQAPAFPSNYPDFSFVNLKTSRNSIDLQPMPEIQKERTSNKELTHFELLALKSEQYSKFLSKGQKRLIEQLCIPFIINEGFNRLVAVFLCSKITKKNFEQSNFMVDYFEVGAKHFGELFAAAAKSSRPLYKRLKKALEIAQAKPKKLNFTSQKELNEEITEIYEFFFGEFQELFKKDIEENLLLKFKKILNLQKVFNSLSQQKDKKASEVKATMIQILFNSNFDGANKKHVTQLNTFLDNYASVLRLPFDSEPFLQLADKLINTLNKPNSLPRFLLFHRINCECFKQLAEKDIETPVTTCNALLEKVFKFSPDNQKVFAHLLENSEFIILLERLFKAHLAVSLKEGDNDFESLAIAIKKDISGLLVFSESLIKDYSNLENTEVLIFSSALLWDLRHLFMSSNSNLMEYLISQSIFATFKSKMTKLVYSSPSIQKFVNQLRNEILSTFNISSTKMAFLKFQENLFIECSLQMQSKIKAICVKSASILNIESNILPFESKLFAKFMIKALDSSMAAFDIEENDQLKLIEKSLALITKTATDLETDLKTFDMLLNDPTTVDSYPQLFDFYISSQLGEEYNDENFVKWLKSILSNIFINKHENDLQINQRFYFWLNSLFERNFESSNLLSNNLETSFLQNSSNLVDTPLYLLKNLHQIFRKYESLPFKLKQALSKCSLDGSTMDEHMTACKIRNKSQCVKLNPFLLSPKCPSNFTSDLIGRCIANCPDNFKPVGTSFCQKPNLYILDVSKFELKDNKKATSCDFGFDRRGVICVPSCPWGWKDTGKLCKKSIFWIDPSKEVLLIK